MRLIDADAFLIDENVAYMKAQGKCDELTQKINYIVHRKIQKLIMDTPTAYDVDKAEGKGEPVRQQEGGSGMRLIDADEFKKYISEGYEQHEDELKTEKYKTLAAEITKGFLKDIDEQPIVYDVDKVCRELLDARLSDNMLDCYNAIRIVKQGK